MKHFVACCIAVSIFFSKTFSQDSTLSVSSSNNVQTSKSAFNAKDVYKISWKADAPITGVGLGLSVLGLHLIQNKDSLTLAEANAKNRSDIPSFDRGNAGFYSESANSNSYIPFFAGFAMPLVFVVADKTERQQAGKILVMYTESLAITSALYTMTAGSVQRSRPLVYPDKNGNYKADLGKRTSNNSQRAFYAGHVAATASASFFAAKVYSDLHPDSKFRTYVWIAAAALPAVTAYYRYEAGQHFLSDCIIGYGIGAASGILVPALHKSKMMNNVTIAPAIWQNAKGLSVAYNF
ncbi:MAG: phosphatase PAP2 family protein [Parafilimonas sp.]|nr:phosphatase PAP2 family protein [Parafilimonas sp.]